MNCITGASGFIGSRLAARVDAFKVPRRAKAVGFAGFTTYLVGAYGNRYGQDDVGEMIRANVPGVMQGRVVYISTSSVLLKHQTPYSRTKRAAEEILLAQGNACIIRPFTVTGVGDYEGHLIPKLIRSCLFGEAMEFVAWPEHDHIDVDDLVDAILNLQSHDGIFEVGTGAGRTNQQVLDMVENVTGKRANVHRVDSLRPYDSNKWRASDFSARQWGWLPRKSFEETIREMVDAAAGA